MVLNKINNGYFNFSKMSFTSCLAAKGSNIFIKYKNTSDLDKVKDVSHYGSGSNVESECWGVDVMIDAGTFPDDVVPLSSLITTLTCPVCSAYTTINDCISESTENTDVCFWLYSSDSGSGDDGWCKYKKDYTIPCSDVKRQEQCGNYGQSVFGIRCEWESSTSSCEEITPTCSNVYDIDICNEISEVFIPGGCFWLYDNSDFNVNTGTCRSKSDSSLECLEVYRSSQCTQNDVTNLGNNCFWLYDNSDFNVNTGTCRSKSDSSLECLEVYRSSQCTQNDVTNLGNNCFWLYDSGDTNVNTGTCRSKSDSSLECLEVYRSSQCTQNDVTNLGNNCFWLMGNGSTPARCENKVF
jgi:hypothetical protein